MMRITYFLLLCGVAACTVPSTPSSGLNGTWTSIGSGWVLDIVDSSRYSLYDYAASYCSQRRSAQLSELENRLSLTKDTLLLHKGTVSYAFVRADALPPSCLAWTAAAVDTNALTNFDVFAEIVGEHYAFFDLNNIDWPPLRQAQRSKLTTDASQLALYKVLDETLTLLNDNHGYLAPGKLVLPEEEEDAPEASASAAEEVEYGDFQIAHLATEHHLEQDFTEDSNIISWGLLNDSIGYVQVKAMWLFADLNLSQDLMEEVGYFDAYVQTFSAMNEGTYIEQERAAAGAVLDRVMRDLADTKALVFDVRFNGGGQDAVSFEILRRLTGQPVTIARQQLRNGAARTRPQPLVLQGSEQPYTQPVFVLMSPQTGSAAEAFALGSMAIPHVTRLGSPSLGALSTALEKTLPNGWDFAISNEYYADLQGKGYENVGVPVDVDFGYPRERQDFFRHVAADLARDKNEILTAVTAGLASKS